MSTVTFVISSKVIADLRDREERDDLTHAQAVMAAFTHSVDKLPELVQEHLGLGNANLSPFAMQFVHQRRPAGSETSQLGLRLPAATLAAIDDLTTKTEAPSRSRLTEIALEHWLEDTD